MEVARINANQWAISIRGFNATYSNKVLVLIDGRSVYTDSFSGVYWDEVDTPLEDIERIEVIRGPGGTVWGANAVNGVINIITKSAADTKGGIIAAGSGSQQTADGLLQYGGDVGSHGAYRVFGKYFNLDNSSLPDGRNPADGWHTGHAGARADWGLSQGETLSVQGDFLSSGGGAISQIVTGYPPSLAPFNIRISDRSGDVLARWQKVHANGSETSLQIYDSATSRRDDGDSVTENTLDVEFGRHLTVAARNDVVWGLDYRFTREEIKPFASYGIAVDPARRTGSLVAAFVQDEIRLSHSLSLTLGSKIEHNSYTDFEIEPSVQLVWNRDARQTFWGSASRAIREPDFLEHSMTFDLGVAPIPGFGSGKVVLNGNPRLLAEQLTDYEAGYRTQLNSRLSLDATGYLSYYHHLLTTESGAPYVTLTSIGAGQPAPLIIIPLLYQNLAHAKDYGFELFGGWQATSRWKISSGLTLLRMSIGDDPGGNDITITESSGDSPRQQFEVRSKLNLPNNIEWDSSVKYVGALDALGVSGYTHLDTRLGWRLGERTELSLVGQNITSGGHFEFGDRSGLRNPSLAARTISARLTWHF